MERVSSSSSSSSSSFTVVFFSIFPDSSIEEEEEEETPKTLIHSLHLQILEAVSPYLTDYIWQHEPFTVTLSTTTNPNSCSCSCSSQIPHFHGKTKIGGRGDNLEDQWFIVFLLFEISRKIPSLSIRVWDTNGGEFRGFLDSINPKNSLNREVFVRGGDVHIIHSPMNLNLVDAALLFMLKSGEQSRASDSVQSAFKNRISGYPETARLNMQQVRVRVPLSVAQVLKHEPCFISLAVEGFSYHGAAKMDKFLSGETGEELVLVSVLMSKAMYAKLVRHPFRAPECYYPMPPRSDSSDYREAELGMKIACGFEMMYQQRRQERSQVKGNTWGALLESLESSGYFKGLLPGSNEYQRLMENAQDYYKNSSSFSRASEMMSAPVRRIDEILAFPHSVKEFSGIDIPPLDDDASLYNGEDELNSLVLERQTGMELYELKQEKRQEGKRGRVDHQSTDAVIYGSVRGVRMKWRHGLLVSEQQSAPATKKRVAWTDEEDMKLIAAVQNWGERNWANITKGDFKGERTPSELSRRWAIIRNKNQTNPAPGTNANCMPGSQLSEAQLPARRSVKVALNMSNNALSPVGFTASFNPPSSTAALATTNEASPVSGAPEEANTKATVDNNFAQQHLNLQTSHQTSTSFQKGVSSTTEESRANTKKETPLPVKSPVDPNPLIQATAVAAGARNWEEIVNPVDEEMKVDSLSNEVKGCGEVGTTRQQLLSILLSKSKELRTVKAHRRIWKLKP